MRLIGRHAVLLSLALVGGTVFSASCSGASNNNKDAGVIDTSCGIDCAAQQQYGLIINRCFEYSASPTSTDVIPSLGVQVMPLRTLEGGVKVIPLEYRQNGLVLMRDNMAIKDGALYLMRREFSSSGQSVTYRDANMAIVGVRWLELDTGAPETYPTSAKAFVVGMSGSGTTSDTTYTVSTFEGISSDLKTPKETYTQGYKLVFSESPTANGPDAKRTYVPGVGFPVIATSMSLTATNAPPHYLQTIRDIGAGQDGGSVDCSLGAP